MEKKTKKKKEWCLTEDVEKVECSYTATENVKQYSLFGKQIDSFSNCYMYSYPTTEQSQF